MTSNKGAKHLSFDVFQHADKIERAGNYNYKAQTEGQMSSKQQKEWVRFALLLFIPFVVSELFLVNVLSNFFIRDLNTRLDPDFH